MSVGRLFYCEDACHRFEFVAVAGEPAAPRAHGRAVCGRAVIERDAKGYVVVAGKDITKPQDLIGKTVATRVGSTGSWFISEYLTKNKIDPKTVTVKNLDTQVLPAALCGGDIAAFFIWQPVGSRTLEICPDKAHYLSDATGYIQGYLVAGARPEWLATPQGKEIATRWLRATIRGRDFAEKNFPAVAAYAQAKLGLSEKATRDQWDTNTRPMTTARSRAMRVKEMCRKDLNPDCVAREFTTGMSIIRQEALAVKKGPPSWPYEKAKEEFLAHVLSKKRADTHRDYTGKLRPPELDRFNGLPVASITRNQILMAVAAIHGRGAETMAEGVLRVLKSM